MESSTQRTLLIDDEPFATLALQELLEEFPDIEVVGTCSNAIEALEAIEKLQPDLLMLDINMPAISGLELLNLIDPELHVKVIFITAHDEYALQAFDANAIDYLLKPIEKKRLQRAIDKAQAFQRSEPLYVKHKPQKIPATLLGSVHMLSCDAVIYAEVEADGVRIYCADNSYNSQCTLAALESLDEHFLRLSRTIMINTDNIESVSPDGRALCVTLVTGQTFSASRRASTKLRKQLML